MNKFFSIIFSIFIGFSYQGVAQGSLIISNTNLTNTTLSFDVTGVLDFVNISDLDSLFFGDITQINNLFDSISSTGGHSKNSGTYDFDIAGGNPNGASPYGEYLYTNGSDILVIGDVIDISVSWTGTFNTSEFDWSNFVVQAGYTGRPVFTDRANIAGGVLVPEPSAFALLGLGLLGIFWGRRKGSKNDNHKNLRVQIL